MSLTETDNFPYFEENDYPSYQEEWFWERERHTKEKYPNTYVPRDHTYDPHEPTIHYFNERNCPIYTHKLLKDSSVINNYHYDIKKPIHAKTSVDNTSKLVLDKLEENYWDMWKPKKLNPSSKSEKYRRNSPNNESHDLTDYTPTTTAGSENQNKNPNNQSHGDFNDVFVRYFKRFNTGDLFSHVAKPEESKKVESLKKGSKKVKIVRVKRGKEKACTQDTQTQVKSKDENKTKEEADIKELEDTEQSLDEKNEKETNDVIDVKGTRSTRSIKADVPDNKFATHKDSIVITKEKLEKEENKEHFQLPKSIRLYRKAGASSSFLKGGSYPLKTCLKREPPREQLPKGNFRLGAPGSSLLFVTTKKGK